MSWGAIGAAAVGVVGNALLSPSGGGGQPQQQGPAPGGTGGGGQSLGGAIGNLYLTDQGAKNIQAAGTTAAGMADPFSQSRKLANTQLQALMANPGRIMADPASQFAMNQGIEATNRGIAARHQTSSGNAGYELMQYGQGLASQLYNQRLQQLGTMASQGASPATAAQEFLGATETAQSGLTAGGMGVMAAASPLISSAGNAIGGALGNAISNWGTPASVSNPVDMTGFQNTSYSPWFQSQPTGGTYDYSTSYGTTPSYDTSLSGLSSSWWG